MADENVNIVFNAVDHASSAITGIRGAIMSFNQVMQAAQMVERAVAQAIDETVGSYTKYADSVRTISQLTNQSTQVSSKLVRVTEEYKISVEDLTVASRKLATQGLSLNVDTIAKLSDQFLSLSTGAERQTFLTKNLGRASAEWTDILSAGSKAILAQNDAVSSSLILTQDAVDKARQYQFAQQKLTDAFDATKIAIGERLAPTLTKLMNTYSETMNMADLYTRAQKMGLKVSTDFLSGQIELNGALVTYEQLLEAVSKPYGPQPIIYGPQIIEAIKSTSDYKDILDASTNSLKAMAAAAYEVSLMVDGVISQDALQQAAAYELSIGLITQAEYDAKIQGAELQRSESVV
jgi:hypothetical protein